MSELINLYGWNTVIKKVDIISGFLGAGKTRFIKKLIKLLLLKMNLVKLI